MAALSLAAMFAALHSVPALAATGNNTGRVNTLLWFEGHDGLLVRQDGMTVTDCYQGISKIRHVQSAR